MQAQTTDHIDLETSSVHTSIFSTLERVADDLVERVVIGARRAPMAGVDYAVYTLRL